MSRAVWGVFLVGVMGFSAVAGQAEKRSVFGNQSKPAKARVTILAVSSSSRQSFAGSQEIYLADIQLKDGTHQFARLFDQYPGYGLPIHDSVLRARPVLQMEVTREPECDIPGSRVFLGTADTMIFDPSVRDQMQTHKDESVPCFKTLHQTIRYAKN